jgi:hypothetical protein
VALLLAICHQVTFEERDPVLSQKEQLFAGEDHGGGCSGGSTAPQPQHRGTHATEDIVHEKAVAMVAKSYLSLSMYLT